MPFDSIKYNAALLSVRKHGFGVVEAYDGAHRVVLLRDDPKKMTSGGLHIADTAQKRERAGTVLLLSHDHPDIKPGMRVNFNDYEGTVSNIPIIATLDDGTTKTIDLGIINIHISGIHLYWEDQQLSVDTYRVLEGTPAGNLED